VRSNRASITAKPRQETSPKPLAKAIKKIANDPRIQQLR
jgi:hypothetical protein